MTALSDRWGSYAKPSKSGRGIDLRSSTIHSWDKVTGTWNPQEARELAAYLVELADKVEREAPEVQELADTLADIDAEYADTAPNATWVDTALSLVKMGYHK